MPLTLIEQERRADRIGASDVPVIVMGAKFPWAKHYNSRSLWLEKTGRATPEPTNQAMELGHALEPTLLGYTNREIGTTDRRNKQAMHANGVMLATLDARLRDSRWLVEFKAPGMTNSFYDKEKWGSWEQPITCVADCEGRIPQEYYWQIQAQLSCINSRVRSHLGKHSVPDDEVETQLYDGCYLVVILHGTAKVLRHYKILRNDADIAFIEQKVCDWWDAYIVTDVAPPDDLTVDTSKQVIRNSDEWATVDNALFEAVREAKKVELAKYQEHQALVKVREKLEANLLAPAGPHKKIRCATGHTLEITQTPVNPKPHFRTTKSYDFIEQKATK